MFKIAICDDEKKARDEVKRILDNYLIKTGRASEVEVSTFDHPDKLLEKCGKVKFDICLLDIQMPMLEGTEVAKEIMGEQPETQFIFISTTTEYVVDAFAVNPVYYMTKPVDEGVFAVALDRAFERMQKKEDAIVLKTGTSSVVKITLEELSFIEVSGKHAVVIKTSGEEIPVMMSVSQILDSLEGKTSLVPCGASYILNLANIKTLTPAVATMRGGKQVPVPRRCATELKKQYLDFYKA